MGLRTFFRRKRRKWLLKIFPELSAFIEQGTYYFNHSCSTVLSKKCNVATPYHIYDSTVDDYTYIAANSRISMTDVGKFCSIGPNLLCGYGIHPTDGVSTSPMFYSTLKQNGTTLSKEDKIIERKRIIIGNDVFIGMNVTVLDGVTIGDGAIIGAGAVVSKDIPPYAIAVGCPIRIIRYRFNEETVQRFLHLKWWDKDEDCLRLVEKQFFNPELFLEEASK
ncbi:MAG TPA: chloramphenicol acetyltransferase [Prevotellaceae bacterium]|nr:chloramphenicol acetyltransferase [Prevotellaceae bacterium]